MSGPEAWDAGAYRALRELTYALFRSNVDWAEAARSCGDPKCAGDCRYVKTIRRIVRDWDGGELSAPTGNGDHPASP